MAVAVAIAAAGAVAIEVTIAGAAIHGDSADALGPLDLSGVDFSQHNRQATLVVNTHLPPPGISSLTRYPNQVGSTTQRYVCMKVHGSHTKPKLLCPGGKRKKHQRPRVGRSSFNGAGKTKKEGSFPAKIKRTNGGYTIHFSLGAAQVHPGSISWSVQSGWTGPECTPASPPLLPTGTTTQTCQDTAPDQGEISDRIFPLEKVGCTPRGGLHFNGPRGKKRVALTFDDGPSIYTSRVLSILEHKHVKGTFFEIGENMGGRAQVQRAIMKHGDELGNHTMHHRFAGVGDMRAVSNIIQRNTDFRPCLFRPPGGSLGGGVVGAAHAAGMATINWDRDTRDWSTPGSAHIYSVATSARAGSIVLMHDGGGFRGQTVAALPHIIANLKHRGYKLVTVTQLLGGHYIFREVHH